jgi:hypothetical protein
LQLFAKKASVYRCLLKYRIEIQRLPEQLPLQPEQPPPQVLADGQPMHFAPFFFSL